MDGEYSPESRRAGVYCTEFLAGVSPRDDKNSFAASAAVADARGVDTREFSEFTKFSKFFGEKFPREAVEAETRDDEGGASETKGVTGNEVEVFEAETKATGGATGEAGVPGDERRNGNRDPVPPAALTLGGGIPGASPRASRTFCHSTAPGSKGGEAPKEGLELVKALKCSTLCEEGGGTPCSDRTGVEKGAGGAEKGAAGWAVEIAGVAATDNGTRPAGIDDAVVRAAEPKAGAVWTAGEEANLVGTTGTAKAGIEGRAVKAAGVEGRAAGVTDGASCETVESSARAVTKLSPVDETEEASELGERKRGGDESSNDKAGAGWGTKAEGAGKVGADETNNEAAADDGADPEGKAVGTARVERDGAATAAELEHRAAESAEQGNEAAETAE